MPRPCLLLCPHHLYPFCLRSRLCLIGIRLPIPQGPLRSNPCGGRPRPLGQRSLLEVSVRAWIGPSCSLHLLSHSSAVPEVPASMLTHGNVCRALAACQPGQCGKSRGLEFLQDSVMSRDRGLRLDHASGSFISGPPWSRRFGSTVKRTRGLSSGAAPPVLPASSGTLCHLSESTSSSGQGAFL